MIPREVFEQTILEFFAPVRPYLDDPTVTEVMINGPFEIFIEREGKIETTDAKFPHHHALMAAIRNLAQFVGRHVDENRPILEARLPDGSRVEAILPPVSPDGPHISIRRFFQEKLTMERLLRFGSITPDAAQMIETIVACKLNIIVAGGTASGKTSMLNVVSSFCDDAERVVIIEDARELQLQKPHVVQLEARPPDAKGRGAITIRDLFRATLRMRPDRIIVGEIRGGESLDMIQAMTSGHRGCMSTVHATHPIDTMNRIETLALMSDVELPLHALRSQVGSAIDFIVHTERLRDGSRCVSHITEVEEYDPERGYQLNDIFLRNYLGRAADGKIRSEMKPTGILPKNTDMIRGQGFELPESVYKAARRRSAEEGKR